jgi:hypothetical protein
MKKFLFIILFCSSLCCYSQSRRLDVAKFKIEQRLNTEERNCLERQITYINKYGRLIGTSQVGYKSRAISRVKWYQSNDLIYALVSFRKNYKSGKEYLYGGWSISRDEFNNLKRSFEKSKSKGQFFWEYINPNKISCN